MHGLIAARAYQSRASDRNLKSQEADVFRRATAALRLAQDGDGLSVAKALADNRLLWITVTSVLRDPHNALPTDLKASILSVGKAVEREMDENQPDLSFLIGINEHLTAGLEGR